jgi:hypothetical protein
MADSLGALMRVSVVNFKKMGKEFNGAVGLLDYEEKRIWVDKSLPRISNGTRKAVENHERAHALLYKKNIHTHFTKAKEETMCNLLALIWTNDKWLTDVEVAAKRYMLKGRTWRKDRRSIFGDLCHFLNVGIKPVRQA